MGKQYRATRTLGSFPIQAGGLVSIDLPRQYDLEAIHLKLDAVVNVTAPAVSIKSYAPSQLLPRLELIADGKNTVFSGSLAMCRIANAGRGLGQGTQITPPTGVAVASYAVAEMITIDLQSMDSIRPKDSNFRTAGLQLWQLRLTVGQAGDMFSGGTVALTSGSVTVTVDECVELPDAGGGYSKPAFMKRVSTQGASFAGPQSNYDFRLPAGNCIKEVAVYASLSGFSTSTTVSNFRLAAGLDVRVNCTGASIQSMMYAKWGTPFSGLFIHDFVNQGAAYGQVGNLSNLWDVSSSVEPKLSVDVSAACDLEVRTVEYIRLS